MKEYNRFLDLRPLNVRSALPLSRCALVSMRDIAAVAVRENAIVMAANIRNPLSALGIMRAAGEVDSFVVLELAKSEASYTGVNFRNLPWFAMQYSSLIGDGVVYSLHMDHYAIKSAADRDESIKTVP
ncbi:MAG: class II fructose-bisphosphate aldolase, partial [Candidatus Fermentibacteraceae bacterium]|nr:class II fructose-bisphosphate aldolase [Candidatus Fermentibacteraceae bacterium]